jgi:hypothetical protein
MQLESRGRGSFGRRLDGDNNRIGTSIPVFGVQQVKLHFPTK